MGVSEGEHVDRPEFAHTGFIQAGSFKNGVTPKVIPTQFSITTILSLLQYPNALLPIEVTLLGIITEVREVQTENALLPIDVTLLGIVTDVRWLQPLNA